MSERKKVITMAKVLLQTKEGKLVSRKWTYDKLDNFEMGDIDRGFSVEEVNSKLLSWRTYRKKV